MRILCSLCQILIIYLGTFLIIRSFFGLNFSTKHKIILMILLAVLMGVVCCCGPLAEKAVFSASLALLAPAVFFLLSADRIRPALLLWVLETVNLGQVAGALIYAVWSFAGCIAENPGLSESEKDLLMDACSIGLILVFCRLNDKYLRLDLKKLGAGSSILLVVLLLADPLISSVAIHSVLGGEDMSAGGFAAGIGVVFLLFFAQAVGVYLFYRSRKRIRQEQEKSTLMEENLRYQQDYYEELKDRQETLRGFRHDMRFHLYALKEYSRSDQYEELKEYLEHMAGKLEEGKPAVSMESGPAEALVDHYRKEAEACGCRMEVKGNFPEDYPLDPYEICAVLSNLLTNAVEAVQKEAEEGRWISLEIRSDDRRTWLSVENPCGRRLSFSGNLPESDKKDRENHGLGLVNVKKCAEAAGGTFSVKAEKGVFRAMVMTERRGKDHADRACGE